MESGDDTGNKPRRPGDHTPPARTPNERQRQILRQGPAPCSPSFSGAAAHADNEMATCSPAWGMATDARDHWATRVPGPRSSRGGMGMGGSPMEGVLIDSPPPPAPLARAEGTPASVEQSWGWEPSPYTPDVEKLERLEEFERRHMPAPTIDVLSARIANSTSTIYASHTISVPDADQLLLCLSAVVHCQIEADNNVAGEMPDRFAVLSDGSQGKSTIDDIYDYILPIYERARFSPECIIIALVYMNRAIGLGGLRLHECNWRPCLLVAVILAQKVWDDRSLKASAFAMLCPQYTKEQIKQWELTFLSMLKFSGFVSQELYARYYFELRDLYERVHVSTTFPVTQLSMAQAKRLEIMSSSFQMQKRKRDGSHGSHGGGGGGGGSSSSRRTPASTGRSGREAKGATPPLSSAQGRGDLGEVKADEKPPARRAQTWEDATVKNSSRYVLG